MASLTITRPRSKATADEGPTRRGRHPVAKLKTDEGLVLELPYAPRGGELGGTADTWETVERPGRDPITVHNGGGTPTLNLTVLLGHADHQDSIEGLLAKLDRIATSGDRVTLVNLSPAERGPWRLADVTIAIAIRQHGTNHITRADVGLSFVAARDANPRLGPVSGGKKKKKGKGGKRGKGGHTDKTRHYVTRKGDTLRKVADKFYGDPGEWRRIARASDVKHPNAVPVGRRLTIPPLGR